MRRTTQQADTSSAAIDTLSRLIEACRNRLDELTERVESIVRVLNGKDTEATQWDYTELRQIIDRTDLVPDMAEQQLYGLAERVSMIEKRLRPASDSEQDVGKSVKVRTSEPLESRAVKIAVQLAQVLKELDNIEDESACRLKEGIIEALEQAAGMEVG